MSCEDVGQDYRERMQVCVWGIEGVNRMATRLG